MTWNGITDRGQHGTFRDGEPNLPVHILSMRFSSRIGKIKGIDNRLGNGATGPICAALLLTTQLPIALNSAYISFCSLLYHPGAWVSELLGEVDCDDHEQGRANDARLSSRHVLVL